MKEMSFEELKKCEIGCLQAIHDFCQEHNLRYFLSFGTLIGAIRHKGFIPWDDDIDILMPRNDYNFFISNFSKPSYKALSYENDPIYYLPYAKVIDLRTTLLDERTDFVSGAFVDVFPMDNLPNGKFRRSLFEKRIQLHRKLVNFSVMILKFSKEKEGKGNPYYLRAVASILKPVFTRERIKKHSLGWKYIQKFKDLKNVRHHSMLYKKYPRTPQLKAEWFKEQVLAEFEDRKFFVPVGYDAFLRYCYRDYMKLPPVEERVTHHTFVCYWKDQVSEEKP